MYIGIDLGSTNIKAAIYDNAFHLVDRQRRPVSYIRENGFVEFDAKAYCRELLELLSGMLRENGKNIDISKPIKKQIHSKIKM